MADSLSHVGLQKIASLLWYSIYSPFPKMATLIIIMFTPYKSLILQDYKQQRPSQELVAKDLHGTEWKFRHIYRGIIKIFYTFVS